MDDVCSDSQKAKKSDLILMDFEKEEDTLENASELQINNIKINYECLNEISGGDYNIESSKIGHDFFFASIINRYEANNSL